MFLQWLVIIHIGKAFHIETCNPHIHNDYNTEIGMLLFKSSIQIFRTFVIFYATKIVVHAYFVITSYALRLPPRG